MDRYMSDHKDRMENDTEVEELLEKHSEYIENVSFGQYDDNGVNIGYKSLKQLIADAHHHQLQKAREEERKRIWELIERTVTYDEDTDTMYFATRRTARGIVNDYEELEKALNHSELDQDSSNTN